MKVVVEERHSVPVRQQRRQTGAALVLLCSGQLGAFCTRLYLVFSSSSFCLFLPGLIFVVISFFAILFSLLFLTAAACLPCRNFVASGLTFLGRIFDLLFISVIRLRGIAAVRHRCIALITTVINMVVLVL